MLDFIYREKLSKFGYIFLIVGVLLQIITFFITRDALLSLVSGIAGVFSVVLCSEKKMSMYVFGFIQLATYILLCIEQNLYGEIVENIFYFATMIIGIILWNHNYNIEKEEVKSKSISKEILITIILIGIIISAGLGKVLTFTNDTQPYLDVFSTVPAFIAQILMILRYKEQWYFWLIVDILTCIIWINAENWCMVMQYIFWTANCIYGLRNWKSI